MKYYLKAMEKEVIIGNDLSEIVHITNFVKDFGNSLQLSSNTIMSISLALEEAIVNIIKFAYPSGGEHEIRLKVAISSQEISFLLIDDGVPFNLASMDEIKEALLQAQPCLDKLGICLIRQIMDDVSYQYNNGQNQLLMKKKMDVELKLEKTMRTSICTIEGITIITVEGRLDTVNAKEFEGVIRPYLTDLNANILINCENLTYVSSSGIRCLLLLQKSIVKNNGKIALEAMKPEIRKVFDMVGCSSIFTIR